MNPKSAFLAAVSSLAIVAVVYLVINWSDLTGVGQTASTRHISQRVEEQEEEEGIKYPNNTFLEQRAYPYETVPQEQYLAAQATAQAAYRTLRRSPSALAWSQAGPENVPGRISAIAVHPSDLNTIYAGSAAGGIFKTTDHGANWTPVFDEVGTYAIGALAIHPTNPNIIYVGTGEASGASDHYEGNGVYKTIDGGATWTHVGLDSVVVIGKIAIDPLRPETVFVAGHGRLFGSAVGANHTWNRGLYRSTDGGANWTQIFAISDVAGCIDVALYQNEVLAAFWTVDNSLDCAVYRSTDNGDSFSLLSGTSTLPSPIDNLDRIGVSIDPITRTYWIVHSSTSGYFHSVYRSRDGVNWTQVNDAALSSSMSGFAWYFGQIRAVPGDSLTAYVLGVTLWKTTDGGNSWIDVTGTTHVDHHDLVAIPYAGGHYVYNGCDGGVNYSPDMGNNWTTYFNMHNTQFYAMTVDPSDANHVLGGTQDNGTNRTLTGSVGGWDHILGGDGFWVAVDHSDPNIIYAEYQYGYICKSYDRGLSFYTATNGITSSETHAWNTPIVMHPVHSNILYTSTDRVYRTINGADEWVPISPDLTTSYITAIGVSAADSQVVYAGSRMGTIHVTINNGASWSQVDGSVPDRWVTRLTPSSTDAAHCYVTVSGYVRQASSLPHVLVTKNYGVTWTDITGNLPMAPVNDVIIDPQDTMTLYVATDVGVYVSHTQGGTWELLATGMPITCVIDLAMHSGTRKLVAATHGRSMYSVVIPMKPSFTSTPVTDARVGEPYSYDAEAFGVPAPTYALAASPTPPAGMSINSSTGLISWTPGTAGSYPVAVEASNSEGMTTQSYTIQVKCCIGTSGNVNMTGIVDLADLSALVSYLTGGGYVLQCNDEANVNLTGIVDLADLSALVSYLTGGGYVLPNCP